VDSGGKEWLTTGSDPSQAVVLKISEAVGTPLNQLHLSEEDFRNAIIFGEPPHGGNHAKRIRFLKVRNSRPDNGLEVAGRTREP